VYINIYVTNLTLIVILFCTKLFILAVVQTISNELKRITRVASTYSYYVYRNRYDTTYKILFTRSSVFHWCNCDLVSL